MDIRTIFWVSEVQGYPSSASTGKEEWDFKTEITAFLNNKEHLRNAKLGQDWGFIHNISGIVNRGCINPPCGTGELDGGCKRALNFSKILKIFKL